VPKKNLLTALLAFAVYRKMAKTSRRLVIVGSGPAEPEVRTKIAEWGLDALVDLPGFLQTERVCEVLATSLVLLMPSIEEQFGIAALEAIAMGVPVIVSDNCGVRDRNVRAGVNGFVVEPDNAEGMAHLMLLLDSDEARWRQMALACKDFEDMGDARVFAESVHTLVST
jgi:glycosyltransferase involved in cell wall biosynthesis